MLPRDIKRALVRITAPDGTPYGAGFLCYGAVDGVLIATSREIYQLAANVTEAGSPGGNARIDAGEAQYEASLKFVGTEWAVLHCAEIELWKRPFLPLGRPRSLEEVRIVSYQATVENRRQMPEKPRAPEYEVLAEDKYLELRNRDPFRIAPNHRGSPVISSGWAVGVVVSIKGSERPGGAPDALIVAATVQELAREWKEMPVVFTAEPPPVRPGTPVFCSYAHEDADAVRLVMDGLRANGIAVWHDEAELKAGDDFGAKISQAIYSAGFATFFLSSHWEKRKWVKYELASTIDRMNSTEDTLVPIPILLTKKEDIPALLRPFNYIDFRNRNHIDRVVWEVTQVIRRHQTA